MPVITTTNIDTLSESGQGICVLHNGGMTILPSKLILMCNPILAYGISIRYVLGKPSATKAVLIFSVFFETGVLYSVRATFH